MALVTTTLAAAATLDAKEITVASATSIAEGRLVRVDDEFMVVSGAYVSGSVTVPVRRGVAGTAAVAHPTSAYATHGAPSDWGAPGVGTPVAFPPAGRSRQIASYSASGAIALPTASNDVVAILNGTSVLAMTIADPDEAINGAELSIIGGGTAAHTLTFASGLGGESTNYDVLTFNSGGPVALKFVACNGYWNLYAGVAITGTVTNLTAGLA